MYNKCMYTNNEDNKIRELVMQYLLPGKWDAKNKINFH